MSESGPRTLDVRPPDLREESVGVMRAMAVIAAVTAAWLSINTAPAAGGGMRSGDVMPYQKLFRDLTPHDQGLFRQLQEGLLEAENVRASTGVWPDAAGLASQGIPPFAADAISARDGYAWSERRDGLIVNYLGVPSKEGMPWFLLLVQEPDPMAPPDPRTPADEQHHRLSDGTILHVSTWMHMPGQKAPDELIALPLATGWDQILVGRNSGAT